MTNNELWEAVTSISEGARDMAHYLEELADHEMGGSLSRDDIVAVVGGREAEAKLLAAIEKLRDGPWAGGGRIFYE